MVSLRVNQHYSTTLSEGVHYPKPTWKSDIILGEVFYSSSSSGSSGNNNNNLIVWLYFLSSIGLSVYIHSAVMLMNLQLLCFYYLMNF